LLQLQPFPLASSSRFDALAITLELIEPPILISLVVVVGVGHRYPLSQQKKIGQRDNPVADKFPRLDKATRNRGARAVKGLDHEAGSPSKSTADERRVC
jgi:hypothetical protein